MNARSSSLAVVLCAVGCGASGASSTPDASVAEVSPLPVPPRPAAARSPAETLARGAALAETAAPWLAGALRNERGLREDGERLVSEGRVGEGLVTGDLELRLGKDLRQGFDVRLAGIERFRTHWAPVGANAAKAELDSGRVVLHDAWASTDALVVTGARYAEIALLLRDARAPHAFSFDVTLPRSIVKTRVNEAGELFFDDARGEPVLRVQAPFVIDATGHRRDAKVGFERGRLNVDFDPSGLAYPMLLDPTTDVPSLTRLFTNAPVNTEGPGVIGLSDKSKLYVVTGTPSANTYPAEQWVFDASTFVNPWVKTTVLGMTGRRYAGFAGIPADATTGYAGEIVYFGGWNNGALNKWSRFDVGTGLWSAEAPMVIGSTAQAGRVGVAGTYYRLTVTGVPLASSGVIFYGGNSGATVYGDVYMRGSGASSLWTTIVPSGTAPPKRAHTAFAGNGLGGIYLAGGINTSTNTRLGDTWKLGLSRAGGTTTAAWSQVCPATGTGACGFAPRWAAASTFDAARDRFIMTTGEGQTGNKLSDLWELNPSTNTWTAICGTATTPTCGATFTGRSGAGMSCIPLYGGLRCYIAGGVLAGGTAVTETWTYYVRGSACTADYECDTGICVDNVCCEASGITAGTCGTCKACNVAGSVGSCSLVPNGQTAASCPAPSACNGASACLLTNGQTCATNSQCLNGFCVDGFCCDSACGGPCDACAASKGASANGKCTIVAAGAAGEPSCAPAVCSGGAATCPGGCAKDSDCSSASYCASSGKCVTKKTQGQACDPKADCAGGACNECATSNCVDGVCCDTACTGVCQACSKARKGSVLEDGVCGAAADGVPDGLGRCVDGGTGDAGCKQDGFCNGVGACRYYSKTTSCGSTPATCVGNAASGKFCDGTGTCAAAGTTTDCAPYKCVDGLGCPAKCGADTDCVSTAYCDAATSTCKPRMDIGSPCTDQRECSSGLCIDNNCCQRPCDGQCEACDVPKAEGKCVPVVGKPHGARTPCAAGSPDKPCEAPSCDGTVPTSCIGRPGADVICQEHACAAGVEKPEARCDGKGTCAASTPKNCDLYQCALDGCRTTCASDADCVAPAVCNESHACVQVSKCQDDGHTLLAPNGTTSDCAPFGCDASGNCKTSCAASTDCVAPALCDPSNQQCVPQSTTPQAQSSGGCDVGGLPSSGGLAWLGGVMALAALARSRRRRA